MGDLIYRERASKDLGASILSDLITYSLVRLGIPHKKHSDPDFSLRHGRVLLQKPFEILKYVATQAVEPFPQGYSCEDTQKRLEQFIQNELNSAEDKLMKDHLISACNPCLGNFVGLVYLAREYSPRA